MGYKPQDEAFARACNGIKGGKPMSEQKRLDRPEIVCLCGSTRFTYEMLIRQWELTKQGYVVLSWCALPDDYFKGEDKTHIGDQEGVKQLVDEVHKRKIDLADRVEVIRAGKTTGWEIGQPSHKFITYLGESTLSEMKYAYDLGKPVSFYPPDDALNFNWNKQKWEGEDG